MYEMINSKHVCNFTIDSTITQFFLNNQRFINLTNENNENYDVPIVVYYGCKKSKMEFLSTFGVSPSQKDGLYYFKQFDNMENNESSIRIALFNPLLGNPLLENPLLENPLLGNTLFKNVEQNDGLNDESTGFWILKDYNQQLVLTSFSNPIIL